MTDRDTLTLASGAGRAIKEALELNLQLQGILKRLTGSQYEPYAPLFRRRRFIHTFALDIGGVSKDDLIRQVKGHFRLNPNAEAMMQDPAFVIHPKRQLHWLILFIPTDFEDMEDGWMNQNQLCDPVFLRKWSGKHLNGWIIEPNPPEVGPQLALQYKYDREEFAYKEIQPSHIFVAMKPLSGSDGKSYRFGIFHGKEGDNSPQLMACEAAPNCILTVRFPIVYALRPMEPSERV